MSFFQKRFSHDLYPGDLIALEFLDVAIDQGESSTSYGDAAAQGDFSYATDSTVLAMTTEAKLFWTTGVADSGTATAVTGLSSSTPREYFDGYISDSGGGTGTWQYNSTSGSISTITGLNFALAIRGLYQLDGYSSTVSEIYEWLRASTSNSTYETEDGLENQPLYLAVTGEYDPNLALATVIDVLSSGTAVNRNGSGLYDWGTMGLLSPVQAARATSALGTAKETVSAYRRRTYTGPLSTSLERLSLRGKSGLSLQNAFTETLLGASRRAYDVVRAAMIGMSYRQEPVIYTLTDFQDDD